MWAAVLAGTKRSWIALVEASYEGQSQQEAKFGGLDYILV